MRVACFYGNNLDPRTKTALLRHSPVPVDWVHTPGPDMGDEATDIYARELEKRWGGDDDFMLVEQDKEIEAGTLENMEGCPELWCGYTYWLYPVPHTALACGGFGVVRFSPQVRKLVNVADFDIGIQKGIDRLFHDLVLERYGVTMHVHGHVLHHHVYEPRSQEVRLYVAMLRATGALPAAEAPPVSDPGLLPGSYRLPGR
jgi:hypothetical protein